MWSRGSSTAVPVSAFASLLFLWFFVSVPLVFVGSYFGFRAEAYSIPVRVNQIARSDLSYSCTVVLLLTSQADVGFQYKYLLHTR